MALILLENISKIYQMGEVQIPALQDVSLSIEKGEFVSVMGASGSGKSTLMNILGCLDVPTGGNYFLEGLDIKKMNREELAQIRNRHLGFVFQNFNLLTRSTAYENVELPLLYSEGVPREQVKDKIFAALDSVGLKKRYHHTPSQLSGGEQQRIAIARALVNNPPLILADEPTGNLDSKTSLEIMDILQKLNLEHNITVVLVTHESELARFGKRTLLFQDGKLIKDAPVEHHIRVGEIQSRETFFTKGIIRNEN